MCVAQQMCHFSSILRRQSLLLRQLRLKTVPLTEQADQQRDVQPFSKLTSTSNSPKRLSRKLSRRTSGLEQDSNSCQNSLADAEKELRDCLKENIKLQQELLEVNLFKNKLGSLLKREHEEKAKLEKQQSAFQNQAFTAICERDRLLSEVDKLQMKEDEMTEKISNLQGRLDQTEARYAEEKSLRMNLLKELEKSSQEVSLYSKVIEKFWRLRVKDTDMYDSEIGEETAITLLQDDEGYWSYGDQNKLHFDEACLAKQNLANLQREFDSCHSCLEKCQADYCQESSARKHSENALTQYRQQLVDLADQLTSEFQQLKSLRLNLKEDVSVFLCEETKEILSLQEAFDHFLEEKKKITAVEPLSEVSSECFNDLTDSLIRTSGNTEDISVNNLFNGRSENSSNFHDINGTTKLDKVDLSALNDDSPEIAIRAAGDDELREAVPAICNETVASSTVHENIDAFQDDDLSRKRDPVDSECLAVATDDSKEVLSQASRNTSGKHTATNGECLLAVATGDDLSSKLDAVDGECLAVATDDSKEALAQASQNMSGKHTATNGECLAVATGDDLSSKLDAVDGECLAVAMDDSKEALTRAFHELSSKHSASDDECLLTTAMNESNEVLAQALQEKVAALLLLSQQEERHILESNNVVALESEISSLKQRLQQVTREKVGALVELAQVHEELRKLKQVSKKTHYSPAPSSGQLTPVEDYNGSIHKVSISMAAENANKASMQSYLKQLWQKGPELGTRTKSLSHLLTFRSTKETDAVGIARLRVENATLRESLGSIRHLCKSANRLRLTIAQVAADSNAQTESASQAAEEAVDGVIGEALQLKVALHSSLPTDDLGWNSIGSPLTRASEADSENSSYDANDDLHIVCFFGLEIVRLVLLAAQLQKRCLGQNL